VKTSGRGSRTGPGRRKYETDGRRAVAGQLRQAVIVGELGGAPPAARELRHRRPVVVRVSEPGESGPVGKGRDTVLVLGYAFDALRTDADAFELLDPRAQTLDVPAEHGEGLWSVLAQLLHAHHLPVEVEDERPEVLRHETEAER
jgi:hypothetical protein